MKASLHVDTFYNALFDLGAYNVMTNKLIIIFGKSREHTAYALRSPKISREHTRMPAYHCHYNTDYVYRRRSGKDTGHGRWRRDTRCCTQEETLGVMGLVSS